MMWIPPFGTFAIWRIAAMVPMVRRSEGSGSSLSLIWSGRKIRRSPARARFTASIDTGRLIDNGCSVRGNTTVCRSGTTGSSLG